MRRPDHSSSVRTQDVLSIALSALLGSCAVSTPDIVPKPPATTVELQALEDVPRQLSGTWRVEYEGGAVRTYVFHENGTVQFVEEARRCTMCLRPELLLVFNDGKIERLALSLEELHVEHWNPGVAYPTGAPLKGIGRRIGH